MAYKNGYTWYPSNWTRSDRVFELNLAQRGLYRELIDRAMLADNKAEYKPDTWARRFNSSTQEIEEIIESLRALGLVFLGDDGTFFCPECEERLQHVRNGKKGGRPGSGGGLNPQENPQENPSEKGPKPNISIKEKENKTETKDKEEKKVKKKPIPTYEEFLRTAKLKLKDTGRVLDEFKLKMKYEGWVSDGWKDGYGKPIKNWKSKLGNTLPHCLAKNGNATVGERTMPYHQPMNFD